MSQQLAVIGGAMGGGGGGGSARTPIYQADTVRSRGIIEIVGEWAWGEIAGFPFDNPLKGVKLDNTPVMDAAGNVMIPGVTFDYRLGTQSQSYIPGTLSDAIATSEVVSVNVVQATPVIRTVTGCDAVRVILTFQALYHLDPVNGDKTGTTVDLQIHVQPNGTGGWLPVPLDGRGHVNDKQDGPYQRMFVVDLRQFSSSATSYDVRVTRVTADPDPNTQSAFKWDALVKLTYAKLRRPNIAHFRLTLDTRYFSSVPKISAHLQGWLCWVPHAVVYNAAARTYTGADWDGTLVRAFTRNPAWFLYTLLLTEGHGLGDHIDSAYQDKWHIYQIAQRCDQLVSDGSGGQEHRYSIDAWIAEGVPAHEMIMQIANTFDAQALWDGTQVYLTQDAPKSVSNLYLPANVYGGRFAYSASSRQVRYTATGQKYNDADDGSRLVTESYENIEAINRYGYRYKEETKLGCYSRGQAARSGRRLIYTSMLETDGVVFNPGMAAFRDKPGDIIRIANPRRQGRKRLGGRLLAGSTTTAIVLDAPVVLAAGIGYRLSVINSAGDVLDSAITNAAGTYTTLTVAPAFAEAPAEEMEWIVYDPNAIGQLYRILEITENEDISNGAYSISAIQYEPDKYAFIDGIGTLEQRLPPIYRPAQNSAVVPPSGIIVTDGVYLALEGMRRYLDISWSKSTDKFLKGYALVVRHNGVTIFEETVDSQSKRIMNPATGDYQITVSAINLLGKFSTSITVNYTLGELYPVESVSITGLALAGGGTTFSGRIIELDWDTDAQTVLGFSETFGVGPGGQSPWFRDFQVDIYDGATLLRSEFPTESRYTYTYEKNIEDGGPRRSITAKVRARDLHGRYSQQSSVTVGNPAPAQISSVGLMINAGFKSMIITYVKPADNDYAGAIIFVGTATGFTPAVGNRVYVGSDTTITIPGLLEDTPYFIRIASYDDFGGVDDYVLSTVEYTKTINSVSLPSPADIKNGLQSALNDPAATPLVFDADVFAVNLNGVNKTPFIIGVHNSAPAILMDADVVITGTLSADQLLGGRIAATEDIIIGNGNARINGDGSIIVYNGADIISNRDFAVLNGGTLSFQRYRGGAYHEYKSVRRVEYGQANSGATVTLPGYWDAQPRLIVSPASLRSYDAVNSASTQTWTVRAQNLHETATGSGVWQFDAIAELNYASSSGTNTVASNSGNLNVDGWYSGESVLPNNTASITVEARFSSYRGNGASTYGYLYRSVSWTIQGWNGSSWVNLAAKTRNISAAEHGQQITDTQAANPAGAYTKVRLYFVAFDTNGAIYTIAPHSDAYNYSTQDIAVSSDEYGAISTNLWDQEPYRVFGDEPFFTQTPANPNPIQASKICPLSAYTPPAGASIYQVDYHYEYQYFSCEGSTNAGGHGSATFPHGTIANVFVSGNYSAWASAQVTDVTSIYDQNRILVSALLNDVNTTNANTFTYPPNYYEGCAWGGKTRNRWARVYLRDLIENSAIRQNSFTFQNYAWTIAGSTAIATGSLNWMAVGD